MLQSLTMTTNSTLSFDAYWQNEHHRFLAMARREWEALADGPIKGTVHISLQEHCTLSIPLCVELNGVSEKAVSDKIKMLLESSTLTGSCSSYDVQEWNDMKKTVISRLDTGDYDFSEGAIVCVDVYIGPVA